VISMDDDGPTLPLPMTDIHLTSGYQLPPLPWLRAFEAAARHSSFTLAAAELNLTQAAVSHQVRSLEKHLGVVLFERLPRNLRLTEIGAAYLPPLRRSFDDLASATAGLFGPVGKRTLTVRAPTSFAALWLAPRIERFMQRWPDVSIRISSVVWAHSPSDTPADIDIRFGDGTWTGFTTEVLLRSAAVAVCHPGHVQSDDPKERLEHLLKSYPAIHVTGYEDLWQRLVKPYGIHIPSFAGLNVDTSISALELVASGLGPTIVLEAFADVYVKAGRLTRIVDQPLVIEPAHYLLVPEGQKRHSPETILFRKWLLEEASAEPGGEIAQSVSE
jgi:LysR family transcriptional regulator, glycine cleavage system transcriptional activator